MSRARFGLTLIATVLLSACSSSIVPPSPSHPPKAQKTPKPGISQPADPVVKPVASTPVAAAPAIAAAGSASALAAGVMAAPVSVTTSLTAGREGKALAAFRVSCPSLVKRTDTSGLTLPTDWQSACTAARSWADGDAARFFAEQFDVVQVSDGKAFATGYYEPEISGSRTQSDAYAVPVYRRPPELVEIDLGQFSDSLKGKKIRGQVKGNSFVPYADRTAIEQGALTGRGLEIAWAADAAEFFFLQVQGSGRLRLPDGSVMRIGYDGQNGKDYTGIGKLMRDRGLLAPGEATMQGIINWIRSHPAEGTAIMRENKSWVFFKELTGAGPLGALGLPLTPGGSVAVDPSYVPLGAPVLLSMDRADADGLWIAQDTGGAIKGSNRFDTFWGAGANARATAGGMSARGVAFVLLPKGVLARIQAAKAHGTPQP